MMLRLIQVFRFERLCEPGFSEEECVGSVTNEGDAILHRVHMSLPVFFFN